MPDLAMLRPIPSEAPTIAPAPGPANTPAMADAYRPTAAQAIFRQAKSVQACADGRHDHEKRG